MMENKFSYVASVSRECVCCPCCECSCDETPSIDVTQDFGTDLNAAIAWARSTYYAAKKSGMEDLEAKVKRVGPRGGDCGEKTVAPARCITKWWSKGGRVVG